MILVKESFYLYDLLEVFVFVWVDINLSFSNKNIMDILVVNYIFVVVCIIVMDYEVMKDDILFYFLLFFKYEWNVL